jgi:hypothetical protein
MLRPAYWLSLLLFAGLVLAKFSPATGFTSLLRFGSAWQERRLPAVKARPVAIIPNSSGYDGQFYAQVALDPSLRDPSLAAALDAPAYRARRILAPATAWLLGLGQPAWILQVYALLNVACWLALAWLLRGEIDGTDGQAFARWFGCLFSMGVLESVRQSLVDLPALLLLLLAVRAWQGNRTWRSTVWLALGHLAREANSLATLALLASPSAAPRRNLRTLALSALPLGLWALYVASRFPTSSAGSTSLGNFTWPLLGAFKQLLLSSREVVHGNLDGRHAFGLLAMAGFALQAGLLWQQRRFSAPWWRIGVAYSILLLLLGPWVWSGYWAVCRAVLPLTIAFNLLLPAGRTFWPLWILGNLTMLHAVWRFL